MSRIATLSLAATAALLVAGQAAAQDAMFSSLAGDTANNILNTSIRNSMLGVDAPSHGRSYIPRGAPVAAPPARRSGAPAPLVTTRYVATPEVTAKVKRQFIAWAQGRSRSGALTAAHDLSGFDLERGWAKLVADDGLRPGDVADAMAAYWIMNWIIVSHGDNNRAQTAGVLAQVTPRIAGNPQFARLDNAQRQEMAEVLMVNMIYQHDAYLSAMKSRDSDLQRRLADAATARFRNEMGLDLRALRLTDHGFVSES